MLQTKTDSRDLGQLRHVLTGVALAIVASGCGRHFDLGEIAQLLDGEPSSVAGARTLTGAVLLTHPDDLDALVEDTRTAPSANTAVAPVALGDVDGDGFGDWIEEDTLFYGGPRPENGILTARDRARFEFDIHGSFSVEPAGDVNGDGLADVLFSTEQTVQIASNPMAPARRFPVQEPAAWLMLGSGERLAGDVDGPGIGVAFGDRDRLIDRFTEALARDLPESSARQETRLRALGDLDADGFADFVVSTTLVYSTRQLDADQPGTQLAQVDQRETVSYVHYGSDDLRQLVTPAARLDADVRWSDAGDLDGDGRREALLTRREGFSILPGSAGRHSGELTLQQVQPIDDIVPRFIDFGDTRTAALGDLDGDGHDDVALQAATVIASPYDVSTRLYLFYGAPHWLAEPRGAADASAIFETHTAANVLPLGDWDNDGRNDLLLDRPSWPEGVEPTSNAPAAREAVLLRGEPGRFAGIYQLPDHHAGLGSDARDSSGSNSTLAPAGDLDGDGFDDLFAGSLPGDSLRLGIEYGAPVLDLSIR